MRSDSDSLPQSSRLARIEQRISELQELREEYERLLPENLDRPEEKRRSERKIEQVTRLLRDLLETYLRMCTRLGRTAPDGVRELAAELLGDAAPGPAREGEPPPEEPSSVPASILPGVRVVQIGISQLFRMADLWTYPESVRARAFLETLCDPNAMRRAINRRKAFRIGSLGSMRPVAIHADPYDHFWAAGVPDWRQPGSSPLCFLPFELPLSGMPSELGVTPGSLIEEALAVPGGLLENKQIDGRLRIYPPGTGVVQLAVTLTFREAVDVETVGRIAQNLEDLLFVDPDGERKPYNALFLGVIDQVEKALFLEGTGDRRWQPPHTVFSLRDAQGFDPAPKVGALARLMALAPGNEEGIGFLESRLREALLSPHWVRERTLALAGQSVALLIAGLEPRDKRTRRLSLLAEVRELVSAAAYAEQALIEDLDRIVGEGRLDTTWLPGQGGNFEYLSRLLDTMRKVMQAVASVRSHLQKQPVRVLTAFAKDVWIYSSPIQPALLRRRLVQVEQWYTRTGGNEAGPEVASLRECVRRISEVEPLFPYPEDQEDVLFDRFERIYEILQGEEDRPEEIEQGFREARRIGRRLGH